jgi:type I restriction enzyme S subunit
LLAFHHSARETFSAGKVKNIKDLLVPLPPLAEQHRIVAKVTELLALCDQLKARIKAARAKQAQLAEVLVRGACAQSTAELR